MFIQPRRGLILPRKKAIITNPAAAYKTQLYTAPSIGNGQTLSGIGFQPDLVWTKRRSGAAASHFLFDKDRGVNREINSDTTDADTALANSLTAFNADGYSLGTSSAVNTANASYVHWLFKQTPGFFQSGQFVIPATGSAVIDLSSLITVGMVIVKRINTNATDWFVFHRSIPTGGHFVLNSTAAVVTGSGGVFSLSGTNLTVTSNTGTYEYYAFAHQPNGIIQCGSQTFASGATVNVNLGWVPQILITKLRTSVADTGLRDNVRGFDTSGAVTIALGTNATEASKSTVYKQTTNGFSITQSASDTVYYLVIKA